MLRAVTTKVLLAALAATAVAAWLIVVRTIQHAHPLRSTLQPNAVAWSDYVFTSQMQLDRWLHSRGASYREWATAHPATAARFTGGATAADTATTGAPGQRDAATGGARRHTDAASLSARLAGALTIHRLMVGLLLTLAVGCLALGIAPPNFRPRHGAFLLALAAPHRVVFVAAGTCIAAGLAIGSTLG